MIWSVRRPSILAFVNKVHQFLRFELDVRRNLSEKRPVDFLSCVHGNRRGSSVHMSKEHVRTFGMSCRKADSAESLDYVSGLRGVELLPLPLAAQT